MADEIRSHELFDDLDADAIAQAHELPMFRVKQRLEDVLEAISSCAAKSVGRGLNAEALQSKLVGFMRNARRKVTTEAATNGASSHDAIIEPKEPTPEEQAAFVARRRKRAEEQEAERKRREEQARAKKK